MQAGTAPVMHVHIQTSGLVSSRGGKTAPHFSQDHALCSEGMMVQSFWAPWAEENAPYSSAQLSADCAHTGLQEAAVTTQDGTQGLWAPSTSSTVLIWTATT